MKGSERSGAPSERSGAPSERSGDGRHQAQPHVLGRLVIEPVVPTPERVPALWSRLGRLGAGELARAIDEVLSRLGSPELVLRIDRLELDAGPVREAHLEEDLIEGVRRALAEALLPRIAREARAAERRPPPAQGSGPRSAGAAAAGAPDDGEAAARPEPRTAASRLAESLRFLLAHGALPWWHTAADPEGLEELLGAALERAPEETRRALVLAGQDARARRRLALQLPTPALHQLVRLLEAAEAAFVIDYVEALERRQAGRTLVPATAADFRVAAWELVLAYLLVERGSQFNRKAFVASTVAAMARHFGLSYAELLSELRQALPRLARAAEPLRTLLDALWDEQRAGEPAGAAAGPAAAQREAHLASLATSLARGLPAAEAPAFAEAFFALRQEPARLRWVLLAHWHRERVRHRIAERPEELLTELVHVVVPAHAAEVTSYGRTLQRAHAARPVLRGDASSFRRVRWRLFLDTLVAQHGSSFNTRAFIRATLERLAAHHNTRYEALVRWLWRELGDLPRSSIGAHPVVVHVGALYRELQAARQQGASRAAPSGTWAAGAGRATSSALSGASSLSSSSSISSISSSSISPSSISSISSSSISSSSTSSALQRRSASSAWLTLIPADQRTIARAVVRFIETLPELATSAFGRGLGAGAIALRVQRAALGLLRARPGRPFRPAELLDGLLGQVAQEGGVSREHVLRWALRRKARRGSVRDEVRELLERIARASGIAPSPAPGSSAGRGESGGEDAVRALTGFLLRSAGDAGTRGRAGEVSAWIDRIERGGSRQVQVRLGELLREPSARRRLLAAAGHAALTRLWSWRRPEQRQGVKEAVAVIEELERVLASSRQQRALREAFWQFLWTGRAEGARRGAALLARFIEQLTRREPQLLALLRSRDAGERLVARALASGAPAAAPKARAEARTETRTDGRNDARTENRIDARTDNRIDARTENRAEARADARAEALGQGRPQPAARAGQPGGPRAAENAERVWRVRTAGVVLVCSLLQRYFERLGLVESGAFRDQAAKERACGLIHFLASGQTELREPDLVLGKVLCGLDVEAPAPVRIEVDEATRTLSESLLGFLLSSWKGIGGTTVQGLRGSYLCREGRLSHQELEGRWTLDVERKTHDVLLATFPWQTSLVKLPWMPHPLFVHWR